MVKLKFAILIAFLPFFAAAQFAPTDSGLTIIVTDGTQMGRKSPVQPPSNLAFQDEIRPLGMADAIQAGAFIERPTYGRTGFLLIFCVNDMIGDQQGTLNVNGQIFYGVYRLIRQKIAIDEKIPDGMTPFRLAGTVYFLGVS